MRVASAWTGRNTVIVFSLRARGATRPARFFVDLGSAGVVGVGGVATGNLGPDFSVHELEQGTHVCKAGCDDSNCGLDARPHTCWDLVVCCVSALKVVLIDL